MVLWIVMQHQMYMVDIKSADSMYGDGNSLAISKFGT